MKGFERMQAWLLRQRMPTRVWAHCDIPCGIYDPHGAQIAALTVVRMNQLINELPKPGEGSNDQEVARYHHQFSRYTQVKETHAELCKQELRVLWGDYFTPDHLKKYPEVHDLFWNAMKLAGKTRQEANLKVAEDLLEKVQEIAEVFWKSKGTDSRRQPSLQKSGGQLLYPVAKAA